MHIKNTQIATIITLKSTTFGIFCLNLLANIGIINENEDENHNFLHLFKKESIIINIKQVLSWN